MSKISVFISSDMKELEAERETVHDAIKALNFEPIWFENFPPGRRTPFVASLDKVSTSDLFLLILWKKLSQVVKKEFKEAEKKNKTILVFEKNIDKNRNERQSKELQDFINSLKPGYIHGKFRSQKELKKLVIESLSQLTATVFKEAPIEILTVEELYNQATEVINKSRRRLCLIQWTSTILFGPRPYKFNIKRQYEKKLNEALESWIKKTINDTNRKCTIIYYVPRTKEDIIEHHLQQKIKQKIKHYKKIEEKSEGRFLLQSNNDVHSPPLLAVGDDKIAIWFRRPDLLVGAIQTNDRLADSLWRMTNRIGGESKSAEYLLEELGLQS